MKDKVWRAIDEFRMLRKGDAVVVAVSGGADSVALLHFLAKEAHGLSLKVSACHVNHHLRGEESDRDQQFVEQLCRAWGIPCRVFHADVAAEAKTRRQGIEECARQLRYEAFGQVAEASHVKVATAHTISDSLETVLFHLARGTSLKGLCGIPPSRGWVIRPLIYCSRQEVEQYCREYGLSFVTDSTNLGDEYTRNRIRHEVIPVLREINPSLFATAEDTLASLRRDEAFLETCARQAVSEAREGRAYRVSVLQALDESILSRVVSSLLLESRVPVGRKRLAMVMQLIRRGGGKLQLSEKQYARVSGRLFEIFQEPEQTGYFERKVVPGELTLPSGAVYNISCAVDLETNVNKNLLYLPLDYDKIKGNLIVRQRKDGDRIRLAGRNVTKSLKKLWNEAAVPVAQRSKLGVFCDDAGVVAVEGFGVDERVACGENTRAVLLIAAVPSGGRRKESADGK